MTKIPTWRERCNRHPDHQSGMVTSTMIQARMNEEIADLRAALTKARRMARKPDCKWTFDDDGFWLSKCGEAYCFNDGGPKENEVKFCHGCGGKVKL